MRLVALVLLLTGAGCGGPPARVPTAGLAAVPTLTAAQVATIALRADQIRVAVGGAGAQEGLAGTFTGPSAQQLWRDVVREQQRHEHLETIIDSRVIVHISTAGAEPVAVVQSTGRQRLVAGTAVSVWDAFEDQWLYTLRWSGGWRVWDAADLPPGEWWPA